MYNLFVSGAEGTWEEAGVYELEVGRCVDEYTLEDIKKQFEGFSEVATTALRRLPCIFAYESVLKKDPKFGRITKIDNRGKNIRISYEFELLSPFLDHKGLSDLSAELDIDKWELNRTHWAVKDVNLALILSEQGVSVPGWAFPPRRTVDVRSHQFDVALSFPGEARAYVEKVVSCLERILGPHTYFYDLNYQAQLARPNLDTLLQGLYRERSKLIVVFLGSKYADKPWCGVEFRAIREIIMAKKDIVMFVRTDDGRVEGVFDNDGWIDAAKHSPEQIAEFIRERVEIN